MASDRIRKIIRFYSDTKKERKKKEEGENEYDECSSLQKNAGQQM